MKGRKRYLELGLLLAVLALFSPRIQGPTPLSNAQLGSRLCVRNYVPDSCFHILGYKIFHEIKRDKDREWENFWYERMLFSESSLSDIAEIRLNLKATPIGDWSINGLRPGSPSPGDCPSPNEEELSFLCLGNGTQHIHALDRDSPLVTVYGNSLERKGQVILDSQATEEQVLETLGEPQGRRPALYGSGSTHWFYDFGEITVEVSLGNSFPKERRYSVSLSKAAWPTLRRN